MISCQDTDVFLGWGKSPDLDYNQLVQLVQLYRIMSGLLE
jgi:hypothetical protein